MDSRHQIKPKTKPRIKFKSNPRVIWIHLDDKTDSEFEFDDSEADMTAESLNMSSEVSQCSDLNKSSGDLEMSLNLIEEFITEDTTRTDQTVDNQNVDESHQKDIEIIKEILKSDSNDCKLSIVDSKRIKSKKSGKSKSKKKLINELRVEILDLYRMVTDLRQELEQKDKQIQEVAKNRPKIMCFICGSAAVEEFLCCFKGCYCSKECQEMDRIANKHYNICIRFRKTSKVQGKSCPG